MNSEGTGWKKSGWLNYLLVLLMVCGPAFLALCWQAWGMGAARRLGVFEPLWGYLAGVGLAVLILLSIAIWPVSLREKKHLAVLWSVKIMVVLGFMLFYESYYGLDAGMYFRQGVLQDFSLGKFAYGEGTDNMIMVTGLIDVFIPDSYHANKIIFALMGFLGVYLFYRAACIYRGKEDIRILYFLGLFPSILFWSSILGKDPVTLLGIAVYALGVVGYFKKGGTRYLFFILLGIVIASAIRIWLATIFVIPLGIFFVMGRQSLGRKLLFGAFAAGLFAVSFYFFAEQFAIETAGDVVQRTDKISQGWARGGSGQQIQGEINSLGDMVSFMPVGAFTALLRPLPGEVLNPFGILAGLENLFLLGLIGLVTIRKGWGRLTSDPVLAWGLLTVVVWACIYGFVSYQNLGTAFRFKLQVMPLLLLVLLELNKRG